MDKNIKYCKDHNLFDLFSEVSSEVVDGLKNNEISIDDIEIWQGPFMVVRTKEGEKVFWGQDVQLLRLPEAATCADYHKALVKVLEYEE